MIYPSGVTADQIVYYGWFSKLTIEQTMADLQAWGYMVSRAAILKTWVQLDEQQEEVGYV